MNNPLINEISNIFYHASNFFFETPDIEKIKENRKNHINGLLGLFFSTTNQDWFKSFGKYVYEFEIPATFNYKVISLSEFNKLSCEDTFNLSNDEIIIYFRKLREEFIKNKIDYLLILESNETCGMGVLINLDIKLKII